MPKDKGFVVRHERGRTYPAMVCETCGEIITDYRMAGVVWNRDYKDGERSKVTVLCKTNGCLTKEPYAHFPWQEMRHFALWLLYNSGVKTEAELVKDWKEGDWMADI